jgi:hypothetical protein
MKLTIPLILRAVYDDELSNRCAVLAARLSLRNLPVRMLQRGVCLPPNVGDPRVSFRSNVDQWSASGACGGSSLSVSSTKATCAQRTESHAIWSTIAAASGSSTSSVAGAWPSAAAIS